MSGELADGLPIAIALIKCYAMLAFFGFLSLCSSGQPYPFCFKSNSKQNQTLLNHQYPCVSGSLFAPHQPPRPHPFCFILLISFFKSYVFCFLFLIMTSHSIPKSSLICSHSKFCPLVYSIDKKKRKEKMLTKNYLKK